MWLVPFLKIQSEKNIVVKEDIWIIFLLIYHSYISFACNKSLGIIYIVTADSENICRIISRNYIRYKHIVHTTIKIWWKNYWEYRKNIIIWMLCFSR